MNSMINAPFQFLSPQIPVHPRQKETFQPGMNQDDKQNEGSRKILPAMGECP